MTYLNKKTKSNFVFVRIKRSSANDVLIKSHPIRMYSKVYLIIEENKKTNKRCFTIVLVHRNVDNLLNINPYLPYAKQMLLSTYRNINKLY